jgi:hypothetical protein
MMKAGRDVVTIIDRQSPDITPSSRFVASTNVVEAIG